MGAYEMSRFIGGKNIVYKHWSGCTVSLKARGTKAEFEWKDDRGKRLIDKIKTANPARANGLQITIRLAGYETLERSPQDVSWPMALARSTALVKDLFDAAVWWDSIGDYSRMGLKSEAASLSDKAVPIFEALAKLAVVTVFDVDRAAFPGEYMPRSQWLAAVAEVLGEEVVQDLTRPSSREGLEQ